jgi:hypothetical protein
MKWRDWIMRPDELRKKLNKKLIDGALAYCCERCDRTNVGPFGSHCGDCPGCGHPKFSCALVAVAEHTDNNTPKLPLSIVMNDVLPSMSGDVATAKKFFYQLLDPMQLLIEEVEELDGNP